MTPVERRALLAKAFPEAGPRLGFGTGDLYGGATASESRRLVDAALDGGFRYFDTARLYGDGTAETVLGAALKGRRDDVVLASKAGILPWRMRLGRRLARKAGPFLRPLVSAPAPAEALFNAFSPAQLRRSLDTTLKSLGTDHLDILLLHECTARVAAQEETATFLAEAKRAGKVRFCGIASTPQETASILAAPPGYLEVVQGPSDINDRHVKSYRSSVADFVVTHSSLKRALVNFIAQGDTDSDFAARFEAVTGRDARDPAAVAPLLLALALDENPGGAVLFSTLRPARAKGTLEAISSIEPEVVAGLKGLLLPAPMGGMASPIS